MDGISVFSIRPVVHHCAFALLPCEHTKKVPMLLLSTEDAPDISVLSLSSFQNYDQSTSVTYKLSNLNCFVIVAIMVNESPSMSEFHISTLSFFGCEFYKLPDSNAMHSGTSWWLYLLFFFMFLICFFSALQYASKTLFCQWISPFQQLDPTLIYFSFSSISA